MSLLTQEQHNFLVKDLGFSKVKSRCPVCYTEILIEKRVKEAIDRATYIAGANKGFLHPRELLKELGLEVEK